MKLPRVCYEVPMIACLIPTSLPFIEKNLLYSPSLQQVPWNRWKRNFASTLGYTHGGPWRLEFGETFAYWAYCVSSTIKPVLQDNFTHMTHMPNLIPLCHNNCIGMRSTCLEEHVPTASYCYDFSLSGSLSHLVLTRWLRRQMRST